MLPSTLAEIAEVTGGQLTDVSDPRAVLAGSVVIDSRQAVPGDLFAAFVGEQVDGHEFVPEAVRRGAVAVLASRPVGMPAIVVPDVHRAVTQLAAWSARRMSDVVRVGVTGSSGKTSTKDLLAQVLTGLGATTATVGSRNNELGVPTTVLSASADTRYLVLEMGARGIGHLKYLTELVPLQVAVVLNVGAAHAGEFGSKQATAQAKGELVEALSAEGVAVLNADDPLVSAMASRTAAPVTWFGRSAGATIRAAGVELDDQGRARFELHTPAGQAPVMLRLIGEHHVSNALAAAAVAHALGMGTAQIAGALSAAEAISGGRMQRHDRGDGVTIIDDAYNANPDSVAAGLHAMVAMAADRRTVAVIGQMAELGETGGDAHEQVGSLAAQLGVDVVVGVGGSAAARIVVGAAKTGTTALLAGDRAEATELLQGLLTKGDIVLVKGSRSAGLDRLVADLLER